ncbi:MAG TPA: HK97 gp10 family phage protein [Elusimicrobiales bacterium]|nr:HK97 gp10 family phage protein [Elusimicrobiales bacterium]
MIRITLKEKGELTKLLPQLPQRLRDATMRAMQESAILMQSYAKLYAPVFRGLLRVSIAQNVSAESSRITGEVGSSLVYASVLEEGRNPWPGAMPPPSGDLRTWVRRKLGDERLAFVVARAIKRRGFRAQPYLRPALLGATPRIQNIFQTRIMETLQQAGGTL